MRIALFTALAAIAARLLPSYTQLPGTSAALVALAALLGLGGWAFHASGDPRMRGRRDAFAGLALGLVIGVLSRAAW